MPVGWRLRAEVGETSARRCCGGSTHTMMDNRNIPHGVLPRPRTDALACMEDVRLAEMWSQGVFINRRHGLAVVVVVLQSWISMINLPGADPKLVRKKSSGDPFAPWTARTCWTARMVWTARMEVVGPGRRSGRSLQPQIYSWIKGMENETCSKHVFTICARRLRLGEFLL